MKGPESYLLRMGLFLVLIVAGAVFLAPGLEEAFRANLALNGLILGVLALGILFSLRQVFTLRPDVVWLQHLRQSAEDGIIFEGALAEAPSEPRLLGPMARMMGERGGRISLSTLSMRTILDSIYSRIQESHETSRYLIGLLVFLGLLGTFWGLLQTVNAVGESIGGLSAGVEDPALMFEQLKAGLEGPLSGMGTAFSSSLFGLGGSLVLGFLELQSSQAHNRFANDLEEWLSGVTKLSSGGAGSEGEASTAAYIQALLEQTADSLDSLQRTIARGEEDRNAATKNLGLLTERLGHLTEQMRAERGALQTIADTQGQLQGALAKMGQASGGLDESTRTHIRNLDLRLEQLAGAMDSGRERAVEDLRGEIRLLTRTLAAMSGTVSGEGKKR